MQERYLGDSHDFIKYALLRHLHRSLNVRLGVNWYLTEPEHVDKQGNSDGEKRHHLKGGAWQASDPDLFERIGALADPALRRIQYLLGSGILPPRTVFFADVISLSGRPEWHHAALARLADCDLVFLDPDNGFQVDSMSSRTAAKYALFSEAADYYRAGKIVISIQFARQCDPIQRGRDVRSALARVCGASAEIPVIRGRLAPNILFVTVAPPEKSELVARALETFVASCCKVEVIP